MTDRSMYVTQRSLDHIDRLYQIVNLAKVGAASTDTVLNLEHMSNAQCSLFEVIHRLASEAVDIAEDGAERFESDTTAAKTSS